MKKTTLVVIALVSTLAIGAFAHGTENHSTSNGQGMMMGGQGMMNNQGYQQQGMMNEQNEQNEDMQNRQYMQNQGMMNNQNEQNENMENGQYMQNSN